MILAVSGGPDSTALMRLAAAVVADDPSGVTVATVDHRLRPESAAEAGEVAAWAAACGLPHRVLTWSGETPTSRIQESARRIRYDLLARFAAEREASHVLTAHTLDDQAETVVMRLLRGSGVGGLSGMHPETRRGEIVLARPFLGLRKARLVATCDAFGWPFLDDRSNADPRFSRARLRTGLMPVLAREGLTPERAGLLARRARRSEDALARRADDVLAACRLVAGGQRLDLAGAMLLTEPEAIRLGVVARGIAAVLGPAVKPARSGRFERIVLEEVSPALAEGRPLKRTLGGALLEVTADGRLSIRPEPPRRTRLTSR